MIDNCKIMWDNQENTNQKNNELEKSNQIMHNKVNEYINTCNDSKQKCTKNNTTLINKINLLENKIETIESNNKLNNKLNQDLNKKIEEIKNFEKTLNLKNIEIFEKNNILEDNFKEIEKILNQNDIKIENKIEEKKEFKDIEIKEYVTNSKGKILNIKYFIKTIQ